MSQTLQLEVLRINEGFCDTRNSESIAHQCHIDIEIDEDTRRHKFRIHVES